MDVWSTEQLKVMQELGNIRANAILEARLPPDHPRPTTVQERRTFIRNKYLKKIWVDPNAPVPPSYASIFPDHPVSSSASIPSTPASSAPAPSPAPKPSPSGSTSFFSSPSPSTVSVTPSPSPSTVSHQSTHFFQATPQMNQHPKNTFMAPQQNVVSVSDDPLLLDTGNSSSAGKFDLNEEIRLRLGGSKPNTPNSSAFTSPNPSPSPSSMYPSNFPSYSQNSPQPGMIAGNAFIPQTPQFPQQQQTNQEEESLLIVDGNSASQRQTSLQFMNFFNNSAGSPPMEMNPNPQQMPQNQMAAGNMYNYGQMQYPQQNHPARQMPPSGSVWH